MVTFSKRRNGLIEKARQLSILWESSIAVLVVSGSGSGKLYNAASGDKPKKEEEEERNEEKEKNKKKQKHCGSQVIRIKLGHKPYRRKKPWEEERSRSSEFISD
ncbi:Transcription factor MADS-box [Arabidopsis thaliana x Arabidopsis arenosa]|uniref:Transcription factor MADS-box n=1 Tax=Arabidopsis thaliana x Arabidopsis arenosa TaxID=1240361 RepID=A0A8T1XLM6_9BRAS|nr:Transcription factor MADS-box [Arabidopsis thaliana x Arabidopsis arenosa]